MIYIHAHTLVPITGDILSPGTLVVKNNIIHSIHSKHTAPSDPNDTVIDLKNMVLFPGFVNAHCHLECTAMGPLKNRSFTSWIKEIVDHKNKNDLEATKKGIKDGVQKLLNSGVTTVGDHISFNTPFDILFQYPLRGVLFAEALGVVEEISKTIYENLKIIKMDLHARSDTLLEREYNRWMYSITPHSIHAINPEILKEILTHEPGPFSIHLAESEDEHHYFSKKSGALYNFIREREPHFEHHASSGLKHLIDNKLPLDKITLIHGNYLSDDEKEIVVKNKIPLVYCPGSHSFFGHDDFPLEEYIALNHPVALGTDSHASNEHFSFLQEIKLVAQKHTTLTPKQILVMATVNGAKALRMEKKLGSLEAGKLADVIGFQYREKTDPYSPVFTQEKIDFMMIDGKII